MILKGPEPIEYSGILLAAPRTSDHPLMARVLRRTRGGSLAGQHGGNHHSLCSVWSPNINHDKSADHRIAAAR